MPNFSLLGLTVGPAHDRDGPHGHRLGPEHRGGVGDAPKTFPLASRVCVPNFSSLLLPLLEE
jgi:hypothetical protein